MHARHRHAEPIANVAETNFSECVHRVMTTYGFRTAYRTQSVAWPNILRGNSLVLINNASSGKFVSAVNFISDSHSISIFFPLGKTMSYLPAICSLVQEDCIEQNVPIGSGPVAIIVCMSSVKVIEVTAMCRTFLKDVSNDVRVVETFGERNINNTVVSTYIS